MNRLQQILGAFVQLLDYPTERISTVAELLYVMLKDELPEAAMKVADFGAWVERAEPGDLEEEYTRTFDSNPTCALELGWHLFGEEYARGMFLVRMREELRRFDIPETSELPDHIVHVLQIVAAMPSAEASRFVSACVQPATAKLSDGVTANDSCYANILLAVSAVLDHTWPSGKSAQEPLASEVGEIRDPLRAFPVADVVPGCGGCSEEPQLIPLETHFGSTLQSMHRPPGAEGKK